MNCEKMGMSGTTRTRADNVDPELHAHVALETSNLLHRNAPSGILASSAAGSLLAYYCSGGLPQPPFLWWWLGLMFCVVARGRYLHRWRCRVRSNVRLDAASEIRQFSIWACGIAFIWAVFPVLFLTQLAPNSKAITAVILAGMAGGSASLMSPNRKLAMTFLAIILLPGALRFLLAGGEENVIIGLLGLLIFCALSFTVRIANQGAVQAMCLSCDNQRLLSEKEQERKRLAEANAELRALQIALENANYGLEEKVRDRTEKLMMEIRERERYEQQLARIASTDSLTGLCNRTALTHRINASLSGGSGRVAILFLDLDNFKAVNDDHGHHTGDLVLSTIAKRLIGAMPPQADIARWGGDEFVVILRSLHSTAEAIRLAETIRTVAFRPIDLNGERLRIDGSIGISISPDHGNTPEALIRVADAAMYAAKQRSGTRIQLFDGQQLDIEITQALSASA